MKVRKDRNGGHSFPLYHTFPQFLAGITREFGDQPALSWFSRRKEEHTLTYRQLYDRANAMRRQLCAMGLAGSHIAVVSENSADWITAFFAAVSCGSVVVCVDIEQPDESIREMLRRSDARMAVLSGTFLDICRPLLSEEGALKHLVLMGSDSTEEDCLGMEELISRGQTLLDAGDDVEVEVMEEQTAELVFTSGTTSQPKMVLLSQRAVVDNATEASVNCFLDKRLFTSLPFYHTYGLNCSVMVSLHQGCHLYINGNLKTAMRDLRLAKPDTMMAVPLMVEAIHNQLWLEAERAGQAEQLHKLIKLAGTAQKFGLPFGQKKLDELREKAVGSLRIIISGGAHLSREISEEFQTLGVTVLQGYGITECSPLISVNCNCANKLGSVGLPLENLQVKLVDDEVWVKGPCVMQGYYHDPRQTAEAMEDGWFKTGDLGYQDKDGFLFLSGRRKNLIVFKNGKKLSPEKLEGLLSANPLVKEVMVYGSANGTSADDVKLTASIYPDPARTQGMTSYEILSQLQEAVSRINAELPIYQQIQMVTIREREFDKTGTKKIKRYVEEQER